MTIKTLTHPGPGPVAFSAKTTAASVHVRIDDVENAIVTVSTTALGGPSHKAVENAILRSMPGTLAVRLREGDDSGMAISSDSIVFNSAVTFGARNVVTGSGSVGATQPIIVHAVLPLGSSVDVETVSGPIAVQGRVENIIAKSVSGVIDVEDAASASLTTTAGAITVESVRSGAMKSVAGRIRVDDAREGVKVTTVSGAITIGYSGWMVPVAKTVSGHIRIDKLAVEDAR